MGTEWKNMHFQTLVGKKENTTMNGKNFSSKLIWKIIYEHLPASTLQKVAHFKKKESKPTYKSRTPIKKDQF